MHHSWSSGTRSFWSRSTRFVHRLLYREEHYLVTSCLDRRSRALWVDGSYGLYSVANRGVFRGAIGPWPPFGKKKILFDILKKLENLVWPPFVWALVAIENFRPPPRFWNPKCATGSQTQLDVATRQSSPYLLTIALAPMYYPSMMEVLDCNGQFLVQSSGRYATTSLFSTDNSSLKID